MFYTVYFISMDYYRTSLIMDYIKLLTPYTWPAAWNTCEQWFWFLEQSKLSQHSPDASSECWELF